MDPIPESPSSALSAADDASEDSSESGRDGSPTAESKAEAGWGDWGEVQHRVRVFEGGESRWWEFRFEVTPAVAPGGGGGGGGGRGGRRGKAPRPKSERVEVMVWTHTDLVAPAERLGVNYIQELFEDPVRVCNPAPRLKGLRAILCPHEVAVARGPDEGATRIEATSIVTCTVPAMVTNARGRTSKKAFRVGVVSKLPLQSALDLARAYVAAESGGEVLRDGTRCTENHFRAILADTAMLRAGAPGANVPPPQTPPPAAKTRRR